MLKRLSVNLLPECVAILFLKSLTIFNRVALGEAADDWIAGRSWRRKKTKTNYMTAQHGKGNVKNRQTIKLSVSSVRQR